MLPEPITIKNAGIVLLHPYLPVLFERMGLLQDQKFADASNQVKAVQILQYVATGLKQNSQAYLSLNKVLCGLPLEASITEEIELTDAQKELMDGMIRSVVDHWAAIGNTSVDGFRGNWLIRTGMLSQAMDKWVLIVEPRAYDILINRSPFSFAVIKFPWMDKPLNVSWKI